MCLMKGRVVTGFHGIGYALKFNVYWEGVPSRKVVETAGPSLTASILPESNPSNPSSFFLWLLPPSCPECFFNDFNALGICS